MSNILYTASTLWQGPYDTEEVIYYSGIDQKISDNLILENSYDPDYPENTAFYLVGNSSSDKYRRYEVYSSDNLIITNIDDDVNYGIDDDKNLVIFPESNPLSVSDLQIIKCKLIKNYASIYKANLVSFTYLNDFLSLKEKAITNMVSSSNGIFLAGVSGKIWFYDGNVIKGPVFETTSSVSGTLQPIPASVMLKHKFDHEDEEYLYVGTDQYLKLYRSKISTAQNGTEWQQVCKLAPFLGETSGGILSMTSAFNKIMMGCRNNRLYVYTRDIDKVLSSPTDPYTLEIIETESPIETITEHIIPKSNIEDFEPNKFDITALESSSNQVFLGLSNKPEIWSYTELEKSNPENDESWNNFIFDEVFKNDPSPAQYYSYNSKTISRDDKNLAITRYYSNLNNKYVEESLVLSGITTSGLGVTANGLRFFEYSDGSDWEQVLSVTLPDQEFYNISCATVFEIKSLSNISSIDNYILQENDLILVKNQPSTSGISNGIYRYVYGTLNPVVDLNVAADTSIMGFYIQNGEINGKDRYFLSFEDYISENFNFYKSKNTVEVELKNLAFSQAIGCTNLQNCKFLNTLYESEEKVFSSTGYTGFQGIEVSDLYGSYSIEINNETIKVKSGTKSIEKTLPSLGVYKNWLFSSTSSYAATTDNWKISSFVSSLIGTTESATDIYNNSYDRYFLRITPSTLGNPSIEINNLNLNVNSDTILKLRVKAVPPSLYSFDDAYIRLYYSSNNLGFDKFISVKMYTSDEYEEYIFNPVWKNKIDSLKIEFYGLPESSLRPSNIDIDYIKLVNENRFFDPNSQFSKIRASTEGRDLKIWLGKQDSPYFYLKNFIDTDNYNPKYLDDTILLENYNKPYLRFGKIDQNAGPSLFAYKKMSFYAGDVLSPISREIKGLSLVKNLPSTGGVRLLAYHGGTIYCATDGYDSNNININPDDRQSKLFYYNMDTQSWNNEDLTFERKQIFNDDGTYNLLGIVRPLNMISYKNQLYLSGQYGNIKVV